MPEKSPPTGAANLNVVLCPLFLLFLLLIDAHAQNACAGPWSITNQPPASCTFYSQNSKSVTTKRLPADVMNHLAAKGNTFAQTALGDPSSIIVQWITPGSDDLGVPLYYASPTDPYYRSTGCSSATFSGGIPAFRAPNNAPYANGARPDLGLSGADANFRVWDQTSGVVYGGYQASSSATPFRIGSSNATTPAAAVTINTPTYCGASKNIFTDRDWGTPYGWLNLQGTEGSSGFAPMAGIVRSQEMIQGQINHALILGVACTNAYNGSFKVFPSNQETAHCSVATNMPPNGALIFLDYTDAQINAMGLPAWKKTLITAMSHYGGYVDVTGSSTGTGQLSFYVESGLAYQIQTGATISAQSNGMKVNGGTPDPVFAYLASQGIRCSGSSGTNSCKYNLPWMANIPNVGGTGVASHIHMADPCIALGYAGQPGGCGTAKAESQALPPAPTGLTVTIK